jgi:hypothetical protein
MTFSVTPHDFYEATYGKENSTLSTAIEKLKTYVDKELVTLLALARERRIHVRDTWISSSKALSNMTDEIVVLATETVAKQLIDAKFEARASKMGLDNDEHAIYITFLRATDQK